MRAQLEISAMRQEVERKLQEKEEEFETTRHAHAQFGFVRSKVSTS